MEALGRGGKIYLDMDKKEESAVNPYLECRDGVVEVFEYNDESGYGSRTRLFYCRNYKHECKSIIRQVYIDSEKRWTENDMTFDSDSFEFLKALIDGNKDISGGKYSLVRDY